MDRDEVWGVIDAQRLSLADALGKLSDDEWVRPSLCEGWTVRDVAAHLTLARADLPSMTLELFRARGNVNRMIRDSARRRARLPVEEIVARLRRTVGLHRPLPGTTYLDTLTDVLVHSQDALAPLGRATEPPVDAVQAAATRVWLRTPWPFYAQQRLRGFRLTAADVDWAVGLGPPVRAPISAFLLLLTGRHVAVSQLSGAGAPALAARLTPLGS